MWPTQLRSIRSQVTKSTLDVKCEEYQSLSDDEKLNLRNYKVVEWFRRSNSWRRQVAAGFAGFGIHAPTMVEPKRGGSAF
jgi:hypothetical protein